MRIVKDKTSKSTTKDRFFLYLTPFLPGSRFLISRPFCPDLGWMPGFAMEEGDGVH